MTIDIYIGSDRLDFSESLNVQYSIGTILEILSGRNNKSFTLNIPRTDTNRKILAFYEDLSVFDEISETGYIYINDVSILEGSIRVLKITSEYYEMIISADDWLDARKELTLQDLDLSTWDHTYQASTVTTSWASGTFYRYPLINFGALSSGETGALADVLIQDMIPMFRLKEIIEEILSDWTINSSFLSNAAFTNKYLLSSPPILDSSLLEGIAFEAEITSPGNNTESGNIPSSTQDTVVLSRDTYANRVDINTQNLDEGNNYSSDQYTVPKDGQYRFIAKLTPSHSFPYTPDSCIITLRIYRRRSAVDTSVAFETSTDIADLDTEFTLDTLVAPFLEDDIIWVYASVSVTATNSDPVSPETLTVFLPAGDLFYNVVDQWLLWPAPLSTVTISEWIPPINQVSFLKAVKHLFNLRFFVDRNNKTVRIEPHDDFFTTNEKDWTEYIDNENPEQMPIANDYASSIVFKFKDDSSDTAMEAYKDENGEIPGKGTITLSSLYAKKEVETIENEVFSPIVTGQFKTILWWTDRPPRIWGTIDETLLYPVERIKSWSPRLLQWEGYNAVTDDWKFEGVTKTSWPETSSVSFADLIDDYYINNIHLIDKGKLLTVEAIVPAQELQQFITVLNTDSEEGFRVRYKIKIGTDEVYGYINNIVSNGVKAKIEFIILK